MKYYILLFFILSMFLTNAHAATIHISKALLLSTDRKFITDITKEVKAKDNVWAAVHDGEYVRVTFEQGLDRNYDNTIYAKPLSSNKPATIEVFPVYTGKDGGQIELPSVATFPIIKYQGFYKVLLTRLQVPTNTFDYKITGGVAIDYIADPTYKILYTMGLGNLGGDPNCTLTLSGSTFYGTANNGPFGQGLIFSIAVTGGSYTDLHDFRGSPNDGEVTRRNAPTSSLIISGSTMYGMTYYGGAADDGIIFSIATTGGPLTDLHDFTESASDGAYPYSSLTISGSTLYGMTYSGGASDTGIIFSIATTGGPLTDLHDCTGSSTDCKYPSGALTISGSTMYAMTYLGGATDNGLIFSIATTGGPLTDLYDFTDQADPRGSLTLSGGTMYGMTQFDGPAGEGSIFSFTLPGTLYGMTAGGGTAGIGIIFSIVTNSIYTDLHNFTGGAADGAYPTGSLTLSGSTLYGASTGGGGSGSSYGYGAIFSIATTGGSFTDLHDFTGGPTNGIAPFSDLIFSGSTMYGMTQNGGLHSEGIIYSIATTGGSFTDLHDFSTDPDGADPICTLTLSGSTFYGMATYGGYYNEGILFSVATTGGSFTDLHNFGAIANDGLQPQGGLILSGSTLFGMAWEGGTFNDGTIFSIATTGGNYTILHNFSGNPNDGETPSSTLILIGSTLYGMTRGGGLSDDGMIFSMVTTGSNYLVLHNFSGNPNDGLDPLYGTLTPIGNTLYGMTEYGGAYDDGIIFSMTTTGGNYTLLHDFSGSPTDGRAPLNSLTVSGTALYGITNSGVIFLYDTSSYSNAVYMGTDF